jgi:hypothetical protein
MCTEKQHLMSDDGQVTVEYVLVALAAAAMATALLTWIGQTGLIAQFFNAVIRFITGSVG